MATNKLKNNKIIFGLIAFLMLLVFFGMLTLLKSVYQTDNYYVLKTPVSAKQLITPDMLEVKEAKPDNAPSAAIALETKAKKDANGNTIGQILGISDGLYHARFPLKPGDIVTESNTTTGSAEEITAGIPDSWVVTSFNVNADDAVGGRITRGVYFDLMVIDETGVYYPFVNVMALDTSVSLASASGSEAADTGEAKAGQTQYYYVGMTPENAAYLQDVVNKNKKIKLVLSPRENEYQKPNLEAYDGIFSFNIKDWTLEDSGLGTDKNFPTDQLPHPNGDAVYPEKCGNNLFAEPSKDKSNKDKSNKDKSNKDESSDRCDDEKRNNNTYGDKSSQNDDTSTNNEDGSDTP